MKTQEEEEEASLKEEEKNGLSFKCTASNRIKRIQWLKKGIAPM